MIKKEEGTEDMTLTASDLLNEISQYEIGNIDKIFTEKDLKKRFSKMDHSEIQSFLLSCGAQFSEIKNHPILNDEEKQKHLKNIFIFNKLAEPIARKKLRDIL